MKAIAKTEPKTGLSLIDIEEFDNIFDNLEDNEVISKRREIKGL